jgi:pimeloyl-ACP methyl ester carboxylesterase
MKNYRLICLLLLIFVGVSLGESLFGHTQQEAGFYTLEENNFSFQSGSYFNRIALRSSQARIWYSYHPADKNPDSSPLFVFYNGGPGGSTSSGLFSANTGKLRVKYDEFSGLGTLEENLSKWTRIGNLLYIDARTTGFSYSLMDNPNDDTLRKAEFEGQNYNSFTDAADFIRVLLRFLGDHPQVQKNPVILVPESYGGIRATAMLHLLLYYQDYANGEAVFQDENLAQEIQNHYNVVFPDYSGQTVPPSVISRQFSHQILIQVAISHPNQRQVAVQMLESPGSPIDQLADETGVPYIRCVNQPGWVGVPTPGQIMSHIFDYLDSINRDPYIHSKPANYFMGFLTAAKGLLTHYQSLSQMLGVDPVGIPELFASARSKAYKIRSTEKNDFEVNLSAYLGPAREDQIELLKFAPTTEGNLASVFGTLQPWDRFFIDLNYDASTAFAYNRMYFMGYGSEMYWGQSQRFGEMFLENAAWVNTFLTNAAYDVVVYSPAIPAALALHTDFLSGVDHDTSDPAGAERPGQIRLYYKTSSVPGFSGSQRTIRFPFYPKSGHAVSLTEPEEFLSDVAVWLTMTGLDAKGNRGGNQ